MRTDIYIYIYIYMENFPIFFPFYEVENCTSTYYAECDSYHDSDSDHDCLLYTGNSPFIFPKVF